MLQKTLRKSLWSVTLLTACCSAAWPKVPILKEPLVTVSVHNDAGTPFDVLLHAESEASRIFRESGIELRWLNCPLLPSVPEKPQSPTELNECSTADFPRHLQLRIARRSLNLNEFTMGISYLSADGTGCYANLFYKRVLQIHETSQLSLATILGHGLAHEVGHLLLGTNSHSPLGLMRAVWQTADLASASKGRLLFSTLESREMRNKLMVWHALGTEDDHSATIRLGK
jgi:hypothetical protein